MSSFVNDKADELDAELLFACIVVKLTTILL